MTTTTHPSEVAIQILGLTKSYGDTAVLDGLDLTVPTGTVYALLGPNGAGKTTTVNICSTLLSADHGEVRIGGHDVREDPDRVRTVIGVTGQFSAVDELLTGRENLLLMADLQHLRRAQGRDVVEDLLARFDLVEAADRRVATYSGGMKRRLDLAMTLVGSPRVIFLDEPTTGLDPRSRRELWAVVREQVAAGVTVLLTTQYLEEADQLADRVGVLDGGRLVAEGTPAELKRQVPGAALEVQYVDGRADRVPYDGSVAALRGMLADLDDDAVADLTVLTPDLDDVFLALTGHRGRATIGTAARAESDIDEKAGAR
ncbi:ATP-binding cassette domain-containing protein [Nocardioides sp. BGMRC 2183]|nr:ATP-binding cassette domain-containing protein [Nocardioides sp. BGMRC 2183]